MDNNNQSYYPGYNQQYNQGYYPGYNQQYNQGYYPGYNQQYNQGYYPGYNQQYNQGYYPGYNQQYNQSYYPEYSQNNHDLKKKSKKSTKIKIIVAIAFIILISVGIGLYVNSISADKYDDEDVTENGNYNWNTMCFFFDGTIYSLSNMTYDDIENMGLTISDTTLSETLYNNYYRYGIKGRADEDSFVYIMFKNFGSNVNKDVKDCKVLGLYFSLDNYEECDVRFFNGITFGMSEEEVLSIMDVEPASCEDGQTEDGKNYTSYIFTDTGDADTFERKIQLLFSSNDQLFEIQLEDWSY